MRSRRPKSNLRRYRNLPADAVLALLSESRDEVYFIHPRERREQRSR